MLKLVAAAGGGALFGRSPAAWAEDSAPQRVIFVVTQHGTLLDDWTAALGDHPRHASTTVPFTGPDARPLGTILSPLDAHRSRLWAMHGLSMAVTMPNTTHIPHETGHLGVLTGSPLEDLLGVTRATSPSLDLLLAAQLARPGQLASLQLATTVPTYELTWNSQGEPVPALQDPSAAAARLFPGIEHVPTSARQRGLQATVARMEAWMAAAPHGARQQAAAHADLLRDLQVRLADAQQACRAPDGEPHYASASTAAGYTDRTAALRSLVVTAFACDATRVITWSPGDQPGELFGAPSTDVHQDWAHHTDAHPTAAAKMLDHHQRHATELAALLDALDQIPEAGGTLLDHTTVVWLSDVATGPHALSPYTALVAGGSLGRGHFQHFAPTLPSADPIHPTALMGPAHNRLLVTVAQSLGLQVDHVGAATIPAVNGGDISATGALDTPA